MPELPEVEVTRQGIAPVLEGAIIDEVYSGEQDLREPLPRSLLPMLKGARIAQVLRRGKYLLITTQRGTLIIHLGMSGFLRVLKRGTPFAVHEHFALELATGCSVRLHDVRRFGLVILVPAGQDPYQDHHLSVLGPEPFDSVFTGSYLKTRLTNRKLPIKQALMDYRVVVGIGNIYANEVLFISRISPLRPANHLTAQEYHDLTSNIASLLHAAIASGGTTIRDFARTDGRPGYFVQHLQVYAHPGEPCPVCGTAIHKINLGQRSTFYCPHCQV